jgi:cellulose synthase/poly-beta-1,6-N-acetylglucosamine synthase-like glycosyltransferase
MSTLEIAFWLAAGCVGYTYLGYPLLLFGLARLRRRENPPLGPRPTSVSVVMAVHNEENLIARRLDELTEMIAVSGLEGEVIVVSDGSDDATVDLARAHRKGNVRVLALPGRGGKAAALTAGCALAGNEVIIFADARQTWDPAALRFLLENFADPTVGAVSGDLVVERAPGVLRGVGLYWRYEKWLRRQESRVHSSVGATGAISAVRRELFPPIPAGTILDDVYWPLRVAMQGYRVVHEALARAYDRLPDQAGDEFCRKVRTLSGNFQLLTCLPSALVPWKNPVWFQLLSHKLLRLAVPWALLALLPLSLALTGPLYQAAFWAQVWVYALGLVGVWEGARARLPLAAAAGSFLVLNAAAWLAFWVWVSGKAGQSWRKIAYSKPETRNPKSERRSRRAEALRV